MQGWQDKISNPRQLGGIETAVIDNGPGRGTRVAWVDTGAGLRYKVVIDRAMDIGEAFYNRYGLAWLSHGGLAAPQPFSDRGLDWLRTFGGGLVTTCGLSHAGGPETDRYGERGLHGHVSNIPAEIESVVQPDPAAGRLEMRITGTIRETRPFGPSLELRRTISGTVGKAVVRLHDEVTNRGNTPAPHMLLYHCNFGWPLVDEGTDIVWKGAWQPREQGNANRIFREGNSFRKCPPPLPEHSGPGEEAAFIDIQADASGRCSCGLYNSRAGIALALRFRKEQLPWLINWQHWGRGEYVTGLEPATNPPIGQAAARERGELILLEPGERREYDLEMELLDDQTEINEFLNYKI